MRSSLVLVAASALLLAACSGTSEDAEAGGETLQDFLGVAEDDPEAMQARFEEEQREVEERVAECMAQEGFEYVPRDQDMQMTVEHPRDELDPEEFREEYGYGLTTVDLSEQQEAMEPPDDPNREIQERMDEAEREAYQQTLQGEQPEPDPDADPDEPVEWEIGGCRAEAQEAVRGNQRALQEELGDDLQQLYERVQSDPRIVEATQAWSQCMREAGWEFDELQEPQQHLMEQQRELQSQAGTPEVPEEIAELEPGEQLPEDFEPPPPPEPDPEALAELQDEELELAADDHACRVEHLGGQPEDAHQPELFTEVREEHEREFVEEHRDVLEELRADS